MNSLVSVLPQLALLFSLLLLSAFFSGSELALFSLPPSTVARFGESSSSRQRAAARLLAKPQSLLVSILLGNLLVNLFATSRATELLIRSLGEGAGSWTAWIGMTILILVAGEITPKVIAVQRPETWATGCGRILEAFSYLILPVRALLIRLVSPLSSRWSLDQGRWVIELAELHTAVDEGKRAQLLHAFEADVVIALLEMEQVKVKEVMTPRVAMKAIPADTPATNVTRMARQLRRTRLPVYADSPDRVVGVLYLKDLLGSSAGYQDGVAEDLARKAVFVPENMSLARLLARFKSEQRDFAVVLDQYGSVAGVVTMQDILEELLGPIPDKHDPASPVMTPLGVGKWLIPASFPLDELSETFGVHLDDPVAETIGGKLMRIAGRIPRESEEFLVARTLRVRVVKAEPHRLLQLVIQRVEIEGAQ
jgi:CBS domain containing-hemolysin-like protein